MLFCTIGVTTAAFVPQLNVATSKVSFNHPALIRDGNGIDSLATTTSTIQRNRLSLSKIMTVQSSSNADVNVSTNEATTAKQGKARLSRPERKALEREKKRRKSRRKHNFKEREKDLIASKKGEGRYSLHSQRISKLTAESSADDVVRAIKRAQNLHDVHDIRNIERFLLEEVDETFAYGYRGSLLARLAVAALHMSNHELARKAIDARRIQHKSSMLPLESAAIIRGLLRVHNVTDALYVLDTELSLPDEVSRSTDILSHTSTFHHYNSIQTDIQCILK